MAQLFKEHIPSSFYTPSKVDDLIDFLTSPELELPDDVDNILLFSQWSAFVGHVPSTDNFRKLRLVMPTDDNSDTNEDSEANKVASVRPPKAFTG